MVWSKGQSPDYGCLGGRELRGAVVTRKVGPNRRFNSRRTDQRLDIAGIEREGTVEKRLPLASCIPQSSHCSREPSPGNTDPSRRDRLGGRIESNITC
jgi:hypothetical protein